MKPDADRLAEMARYGAAQILAFTPDEVAAWIGREAFVLPDWRANVGAAPAYAVLKCTLTERNTTSADALADALLTGDAAP